MATGESFVTAVSVSFGMGDNGLLALAMGILIISVMRRFDGMFEDQKVYLRRQEEERKRLQNPDKFGADGYYEISEEDMSILRKFDEDI